MPAYCGLPMKTMLPPHHCQSPVDRFIIKLACLRANADSMAGKSVYARREEIGWYTFYDDALLQGTLGHFAYLVLTEMPSISAELAQATLQR